MYLLAVVQQEMRQFGRNRETLALLRLLLVDPDHNGAIAPDQTRQTPRP
jgi:hypothetical protein